MSNLPRRFILVRKSFLQHALCTTYTFCTAQVKLKVFNAKQKFRAAIHAFVACQQLQGWLSSTEITDAKPLSTVEVEKPKSTERKRWTFQKRNNTGTHTTQNSAQPPPEEHEVRKLFVLSPSKYAFESAMHLAVRGRRQTAHPAAVLPKRRACATRELLASGLFLPGQKMCILTWSNQHLKLTVCWRAPSNFTPYLPSISPTEA